MGKWLALKAAQTQCLIGDALMIYDELRSLFGGKPTYRGLGLKCSALNRYARVYLGN